MTPKEAYSMESTHETYRDSNCGLLDLKASVLTIELGHFPAQYFYQKTIKLLYRFHLCQLKPQQPSQAFYFYSILKAFEVDSLLCSLACLF